MFTNCIILFPPLIRRIGKSNFRASRFLHFFSETFSPLIEAIIVFMPFKVSEVRFIFYSFTATLMSSKTAFATSVSELSSGDVIILKSWSFLTVGEHVRSRYVANVAALFTGVRGSADCSFFIALCLLVLFLKAC